MTNLVKWTQSDMDEEPVQELDPSMIPQDPPNYVPVAEEISAEDEFIESLNQSEEEEEQDDSEILADARLRLEQGRLYEMLMTNDIFQNMDADEQAIKNVQREIKRFAKERMEVMLGMKEPVKESNNAYSQFNSLEVDILKSLAKKLSGGESEKVTPVTSGPSQSPKSNTLTPISSNTNKTKAVLKNVVNKPTKKPKEQPQQKPKEEPTKPISEMTFDEKIAHAQKTNAKYEARKVAAPQAIPMPSYDALNAANMLKADKTFSNKSVLNTIASNLLKG